VQRDIKSLMKFEPASRILTEDPALADRVSNQRMGQPSLTTYNAANDHYIQRDGDDKNVPSSY